MLSILFIVEDLLNIFGDSWTVSAGKRRIMANGMDIVLIAISFIYYFLSCSNAQWCNIIGSLIIILKLIRAYKVRLNGVVE